MVTCREPQERLETRETRDTPRFEIALVHRIINEISSSFTFELFLTRPRYNGYMPRTTRAIAVGLPHHVVHRGNNKGRIFFDKQDRAQYLNLLKKYAEKWNSPVLAYCLMTNHVHLLTRPKQRVSLFKMMQGISQSYAQYVNRKYKRTGRLWESRYYSSIIGEDRYLWAVIRYIEQNPRRARIVEREVDYAYSSAKAHIEGKEDDLIGEQLFDEWQRKEYLALLKEGLSREGIKRIRSATRAQRPLGSDAFIKKMEEKMDCTKTAKKA